MQLQRRDWVIYISDGSDDKRLLKRLQSKLKFINKNKNATPEDLVEARALATSANFALHSQLHPPQEGNVNVITNTYTLMNIHPDQLVHVACTMAGADGQIRVIAANKYLYDLMMSKIIEQRRLSSFLSDQHPAFSAYAQNIFYHRDRYQIKPLKGFLEGKPILYCGAGPSLEQNFDKIKEIIEKDQAFVITGGTGIKIFHDRGIAPHMVIALDPFDHEYQRFENLSENWQKSTVLLADRILNPKCVREWKGKLITTQGIPMCKLGHLIEGEDIDIIDQGRVGVTTWMSHLADYFKASKVYMIGVDMCYGDSGNAYADNHEMFDIEKSDLEYKGKKTRLNWVYESEDLAVYLKGKSYEAFQCNKDALEIEGVPFASIDDLKESIDTTIPLELESIEDAKKHRHRLRDFGLNMGEWADRNKFLDPDFKKSDAYMYMMEEYDLMAEHLYWRTGLYNYALVKSTMRSAADVIKLARQNKDSDETIPSHMNSYLPVKKSLNQIHLEGRRTAKSQNFSNPMELSEDDYYAQKSKESSSDTSKV